MRKQSLFIVLAAGILLAPAPPAAAKNKASKGKSTGIPVLVDYDHAAGGDAEYKIQASDGETFQVRISNTCPEEFFFKTIPVPAAPPPRAKARQGCEAKDYLVLITHREGNGGYLVQIRQKGTAPVTMAGDKVLNDATLVISVTTRTWDIGFTSGFTLSKLTNPRFGLNTRMVDGAEKQFVVQDRDAEDDANLGLGAFVSVFHYKHPGWGISFGLGLSEDSDTSYYLGPTWRWSDRGGLTFGYALGKVDQLPPGTDLEQPVAGDFLQNLDSKIKGDFFIAFTYTFLGGRDRFDKPFKTVDAAQGKAEAAAADTAGQEKEDKEEDEEEEEQENPPGNTPDETTPARTMVSTLGAPANLHQEGDLVQTGQDTQIWTISLAWDAVDGATGYDLLQSANGCGEGFGVVPAMDGAATRREVSSLLPGVWVYFQVRARDQQGDGPLSSCLPVQAPALSEGNAS